MCKFTLSDEDANVIADRLIKKLNLRLYSKNTILFDMEEYDKDVYELPLIVREIQKVEETAVDRNLDGGLFMMKDLDIAFDYTCLPKIKYILRHSDLPDIYSVWDRISDFDNFIAMYIGREDTGEQDSKKAIDRIIDPNIIEKSLMISPGTDMYIYGFTLKPGVLGSILTKTQLRFLLGKAVLYCNSGKDNPIDKCMVKNVFENIPY